MLDLNAFHHLPQLDTILDELARQSAGLVIVAGFEPRPQLESERRSSGRGFMFGIIARQIFSAHPLIRAAIVTQEKDAQLRLPTRSRERVKILSPKRNEEYASLLERALKAGPPLLFAESFVRECMSTALEAARGGRCIVTQLDTPLAGEWVARELREVVADESILQNLSAVIAVQRIATLCDECKKKDGEFSSAGGCDHCNGTGRSGEISIFDVWRADPHIDPLQTPSVLSFHDYGMELARQGVVAVQDIQSLETAQTHRLFHLLTASERHTLQATQSLRNEVLDLRTKQRTYEQQYFVSMALQQVGYKLLELESMQELGAYICRRAEDLCGADRAVLYLLHHDQTAEIVALNGWEKRWLNTRVNFETLFRPGDTSEGHLPFAGYPPGIPTRTADEEGAYVRAGLRVPLVAQREVVGAMIFHSTLRANFGPGEEALLHALANAGAAAIQRADLIDSLREKIAQLEAAQEGLAAKERLDRELELARTVQQNMLPHQFPLVAGLKFYARNEPARQVGGDFYDVFLLDENRVGLVIADVSDKGMPAALFMALTRSLVRAEAQNEPSPEQVLRRVHRLLLELAEPTQFVTLFYAVLNVHDHTLTYVRAGHDYPLVIRADEVITIRGVGTMLGLLDEREIVLHEQQMVLEHGDRLVLYTDGLTDAINADSELFDRARLRQVAIDNFSAPIEQMGDALFDAVQAYQGDMDQFDDMTLLIVGVN